MKSLWNLYISFRSIRTSYSNQLAALDIYWNKDSELHRCVTAVSFREFRSGSFVQGVSFREFRSGSFVLVDECKREVNKSPSKRKDMRKLPLVSHSRDYTTKQPSTSPLAIGTLQWYLHQVGVTVAPA